MMDNRQNACRIYGNSTVSNTGRTAVSQRTKPCRKELMNKINEYSFAVNEMTLFLDTHPYDTDALAFFQKYRVLRMEAIDEYAKYYAPLLIDHAPCEKTPWSWTNEPWPWEGVEC